MNHFLGGKRIGGVARKRKEVDGVPRGRTKPGKQESKQVGGVARRRKQASNQAEGGSKQVLWLGGGEQAMEVEGQSPGAGKRWGGV